MPKKQRHLILLSGFSLLTAACQTANPWTTDPAVECRSFGFAADSRRYSECLHVQKAAQGSQQAPEDFMTQKSHMRSCDTTTGQCATTLLQK